MLFSGAKCRSTGDIKIYAVHPKFGLFRHLENGEREWIHWDDSRLQCREIPVTSIDGEDEEPEYECPYGSISFDDLNAIIEQATQ